MRLSSERLSRRLHEMAEPSVVKDAAALKHEALSSYEAAAALLQHKVDFPPNKDSTSKDVDEWISDAYLQWVICSNFWRPAGIKKAAWNDVEYSLLACLALVNRELLDDSGRRFNELVHHAVCLLSPWSSLVVLTHPLYFQHKYSIPNLRPVPLHTPSPSPEPALWVQTPASPRTMTPPPVPPPPQKERTPALQKQQSTAPITPQQVAPRCTPNLAGSVPNLDLSAANLAANTASSNIQASGSMPFIISKPPLPRFTTPLTSQPAGQSSSTQRKAMPKFSSFSPSNSTEAFQKDWALPLHRKPGQQLKIEPPKDTMRSEAPNKASSRMLAIDGRHF